MSKQTKPDFPTVRDPHETHTVFVNQLVGSGHLNGVVNLTFATCNFTPQGDGTVQPDLVVTSRLRMDLFCAQALFEQLGKLIQQMSLPPANSTTH